MPADTDSPRRLIPSRAKRLSLLTSISRAAPADPSSHPHTKPFLARAANIPRKAAEKRLRANRRPRRKPFKCSRCLFFSSTLQIFDNFFTSATRRASFGFGFGSVLDSYARAQRSGLCISQAVPTKLCPKGGNETAQLNYAAVAHP